jgi:hypothetical protein
MKHIIVIGAIIILLKNTDAQIGQEPVKPEATQHLPNEMNDMRYSIDYHNKVVVGLIKELDTIRMLEDKIEKQQDEMERMSKKIEALSGSIDFLLEEIFGNKKYMYIEEERNPRKIRTTFLNRIRNYFL